MIEDRGLGEFLRVSRGRVSPEEVGLPRGDRRVPGLRREEVATLAGVSVDYYRRLEQGRERNPSTHVLGALARVLRLDDDRHEHLLHLAGVDPTRRSARSVAPVDPALRQLLEQWSMNPAYVLNAAQDILASNAVGRALHSGFADPDNFARMVFCDPAARSFFLDWEDVASGVVASLRLAWGRDATRERTAEVVAELSGQPSFDRWWSGHVVARKTRTSKRLCHPDVDTLTLDYHSFAVDGRSDQYLVVCRAEAGSRDEGALTMLAQLADERRQPSLDADGSPRE